MHGSSGRSLAGLQLLSQDSRLRPEFCLKHPLIQQHQVQPKKRLLDCSLHPMTGTQSYALEVYVDIYRCTHEQMKNSPAAGHRMQPYHLCGHADYQQSAGYFC